MLATPELEKLIKDYAELHFNSSKIQHIFDMCTCCSFETVLG
jgi:hypothetical protein